MSTDRMPSLEPKLLEITKKIVYLTIHPHPSAERDILLASIVSEVASLISNDETSQEIQNIVKKFGEEQGITNRIVVDRIEVRTWPPGNPFP